jgi:hypothetical protein
VNTAGLLTQIHRYKSSAPDISVKKESAGTMVEHSSANNMLAIQGNAAACCVTAQATVTKPGCCVPEYKPYPTNGYKARRCDGPEINYPPLDPTVCRICPQIKP